MKVRDGIADQSLVIVRIALLDAGFLKPPAHAGQRRPQIVRDVIADLFNLNYQRFDALKHRIEVLRQVLPFVLRPTQRDRLPRPLFMIARLVALID